MCVRYFGTYDSPTHLFILMNLGVCDFNTFLREDQAGGMSESTAQFYLTQILDAVKVFESQSILLGLILAGAA